jgi:methylenetetrahydrofolate reductase (NADPH)
MLPMQAFGGLNRMKELCKTDVPAEVMAKAESLKDDADAFKAYGAELTAEQCAEIYAKGVNHIHFYTLNTTYSTFTAMKHLSIFTEVASKQE